MVPGPAQAAAVAALGDQDHVDLQRERYRARLERMSAVLGQLGLPAPLPAGGFYLWVPAPDGDAWALARRLASELGVIGSPGEFYGNAAPGHLRLAVVQPDGAFDLVARRGRDLRSAGFGGGTVILGATVVDQVSHPSRARRPHG